MQPRQGPELPETDASVSELPVVDFPSEDATQGATSVRSSLSDGTLDNSAQALYPVVSSQPPYPQCSRTP